MTDARTIAVSLTEAQRRKLQGMIDRTAKASAAYHREQAKLNDWCHERYGFEPGDRDVDEIIDCVFDGCGVSAGMDAEDFNRAMIDAAETRHD